MPKNSNVGKLTSILEEIRAGIQANNKGVVAIKTDDASRIVSATTEIQTIDDPPWADDVIDGDIQTWPDAEIRGLHPKQPNLVYMPMCIQSSWIPRQGSPDHYIRKFRASTVISTQSYTPSGRPIGLPSGLMARRVLLSLVTKAVITKSREIEVPSIVDLLKWSNLGLSGVSHRSAQKNLFQLGTMNIDIWFAPDGKKATIYKGQIFDQLNVTIEPTDQQKFSFIPDRVLFSKDFYESIIRDRSIPYMKDLVMEAQSPLEHDILLWLLQRASSDYLREPVGIPYHLFQDQFGTPGSSYKHFKYKFRKLMKSLIEKHQFPVELEKEGVVLFPIETGIPKKSKKKSRKYMI